ncbi:MAG: SEL1-like repeat protein [Herminiimonas sp.]|nr:SEL1-like repeat protein [Herminiimonas sp.]
MATREEIRYIRAARAGKAPAQLTLGKHYLFGGTGLKRNLTTSLYWLHRAAIGNEAEAWMLIGSHIPFEIAAQAPDRSRLCVWYERAFQAGVIEAGLVWAKLVLSQADEPIDQALRLKALKALEAAAAADIHEAQWLLAQQLGQAAQPALEPQTRLSLVNLTEANASEAVATKTALKWATLAASNGVSPAQRALAEHAWSIQDHSAFLHWSMPLACEIADHWSKSESPLLMPDADAILLTRCARVLIETNDSRSIEVERFLMLAAEAGNRDARFRLGIWYGKLDEKGNPVADSSRRSKYGKSIQWLTLAGEQGDAKAWYALFKICMKPNTGLSQHSLKDAYRYLERAAEEGHGAAQFESGMNAWRKRRSIDSNDVRAAYWLQKAAAQGNSEALARLKKIASPAAPATWAQAARRKLSPDVISAYPFLSARIQLAAVFGLSRHEALLLDLNTADCGHCLLVDIRTLYARSKRRLILIQTGEEYLLLNAIVRQFANIDCGPNGPEGNYRQRIYLLSKILSASSLKDKEKTKDRITPSWQDEYAFRLKFI